MSVDFRPTLPAQTVEADVEAPMSAGHDAGASSFAGRLRGILSPAAAPLPVPSAAERGRRRSSTPASGVERYGGATRSVPHVDVAQVAAVPLPANVACAPRFEGAAQLLAPLAQLSQLGATMEGDDRAPPRERPHHRTAEPESSAADVDEPTPHRPSRAHAADAASAGQGLPAAPRHEAPVAHKAPVSARASEPPPSPAGPAPQAIAARLAKAVAAGVASLSKAATLAAAPPVADAAQSPSAEQAKPRPAAASPASSAAPAAAPLRAPASAADAPPLPKAASAAKARAISTPAAEAAVHIAPGAAEPHHIAAAPAPVAAKPSAYVPPEASATPMPDVHWKKGDAHLSLKTDSGDLSLHVRVKDGTTEVAAAGPAAKHLGAAGAHLQAQLAKEGLVLGRFAMQTTARVASLDDPAHPFARQDPDEDDGTASAEGDDQRLISGKGRSRSLRRMHVKA